MERINALSKERFLTKVRNALWVLRDKKIAVWGLAFKPDTDDIRCSVAMDIVGQLLKEGAKVTVYDPKGMEKAKELGTISGATFASSPLEAANGAEALIIATEWNEFSNVDLAALKESMQTPLLFDGRNLLNPGTAREAGFTYVSVGRA